MSNDDNAIKQAEVFSITLGSISIVFPLSVIIILLLRYDKLLKDKDLVHYIFMIATCDCITAATIAAGFPDVTSLGCVTQGFFFIFFSRASWFFTNVLVFSLCCIIIKKQYFLNLKVAHFMLWTINIILQIVPYITKDYNDSPYGPPNDDNSGVSRTRCFFSDGAMNDYRWDNLLFRNILFSSFFFNALCALVAIYYSKVCMTEGDPLKYLWTVVLLYPLALCISWFPVLIYKSKFPNENIVSDYLKSAVATYGIFLTIIFYVKTDQAREEWYKIYHNMIYSTEYRNDMRSSDTSSQFRDSNWSDRKSLQLTESIIINPLDHKSKEYIVHDYNIYK